MGLGTVDTRDDKANNGMEGKDGKDGKAAGGAGSGAKKRRVLLLSSRHITTRHRHLMNDLDTLLPHSKKESKVDGKDALSVINELCELRSCNSCIFFEVRRKKDLFMWFANSPAGPSVKFHVLNVHTMLELRMAGNCLKGSRPLLSFDGHFDETPQYKLVKEVFTQIFATPKGHPQSKPFIDHVMSFSLLDNKVWFRHFQIVWPTDPKADLQLVEIGPRFVLNLVRIFDGSFQGSTLYTNPAYVAPSQLRRMHQARTATKYEDRVSARHAANLRKGESNLPEDELDDVFD